MKQRFILAALTCLAPFTVQAQVANGLYEHPFCQQPQSSSIVRIEGNTLWFFESSCALSNARNVAGLANTVQYDARCSGEGEAPASWTTYTIQSVSNGLVLTHAQNPSFSYAYCGM